MIVTDVIPLLAVVGTSAGHDVLKQKRRPYGGAVTSARGMIEGVE
jgi:hypothetical protein